MSASASTQERVNRMAERCEDVFLLALFEPWVKPMVEAAKIRPGYRVLDVACGRGILTCHVSERVGPQGSVVGVDTDPALLAAGRRQAPDIQWLRAPAEALPFEDTTFDAALSHFGLMFFEDREAALREMLRVLRPGGRMVFSVWDGLDRVPGYKAMTELLARLFGREVAETLHAPYCLGSEDLLESLCKAAGVESPVIERCDGMARFPSVADWVKTDVEGRNLGEVLDERQIERLKTEAEKALKPFIGTDGAVKFDHPAILITATKG